MDDAEPSAKRPKTQDSKHKEDKVYEYDFLKYSEIYSPLKK